MSDDQSVEAAAFPFPDAGRVAGRWVRLDLAVRSSLTKPPACELLVFRGPGPCRKASERLTLMPDSSGRMRFYFRVPVGCERLLLKPVSAVSDFSLIRFSIRPWRFQRVLIAVLLNEFSLGPIWLARKFWRAARAARGRGPAMLARYFLDNLERNIAGYGFLIPPTVLPHNNTILTPANARILDKMLMQDDAARSD